MKVQMSKYLLTQKELLNELIEVLSNDFKYASVLAVDSTGTSFTVGRTGCSISDSMLCERGFVVRVFNGVNYSEYSFNEFSALNISEVIQAIKDVVISDVKKLKDGDVKFMDYPLIEENPIEESYQGEVGKGLNTLTTKEKIDFLTKVQQEGIGLSELLVEFRAGYEEVQISKMFYSTNKKLEQTYIFTNASLVAVANEKGNVKYSFDSFSGLKGVEILDELVGKQQSVVDKTIELLKAEKVIPGEYDIICNPAVSGLIAHEAFGHGVEMDMFVKDRAKGAEYIDKRVGSDKTTMHDGALSAKEVGTYLFDDEGTFGTDTKVIADGILKAGISDLLSALKLGTTPTGNGRRESFEKKAYSRMTNTFFAAGDDKLEDMIASIEFGYLVEDFNSGMEDPKNWGIQCMLAKGQEIVDGKLTGKLVAPILLTGYVPDLLNSISMVSDGLELSGGGFCGKGHKEWVKTSTGGTYIKARGRLG